MKTLPACDVAIRQGALGPQANYFATPGLNTCFDTAGVQRGDAQAYSLAGCRILDTSDERTVIALLQRAIALETDKEILHKLRCALSDASEADPFVDSHLADEAPLLQAACELGFHGLNVWENDDASGPTRVLLAGDAPVQVLTRAAAQVALARRHLPAQPAPSPERMVAIETLDVRLHAKWSVGLDQDDAITLCGSDVDQIEAALTDWEARLGIEIDDLAAALGARAGRAPGP
jgi:hypothetical protein